MRYISKVKPFFSKKLYFSKRLDLKASIIFAESCMQKSDFTTAIIVWEDILHRFRDTAPNGVYVRLSIALTKNNQHQKALTIIESLYEKNPSYATKESVSQYVDIAITNENWLALKIASEKMEMFGKKFGESSVYSHTGRYYQTVASLLLGHDSYKNKIVNYIADTSDKNNTTAVVTAISGNYDTLKLPTYLDSTIDYVIFTDQDIEGLGVFKVKNLPGENNDPTKKARYVKTHLMELLPDYETIIWIDGSVMIREDISTTVDTFHQSKADIGLVPHPIRKNIYEEADACIAAGKDSSDIIKKQIDNYRHLKVKGDGLVETGVFMIKRSPSISNLMDIWWREIDKYSRRDQISLIYALENTDVNIHYLMDKSENLRNHSAFLLATHNSDNRPLEALYRMISEDLNE